MKPNFLDITLEITDILKGYRTVLNRFGKRYQRITPIKDIKFPELSLQYLHGQNGIKLVVRKGV